jgi:hypothetical protein
MARQEFPHFEHHRREIELTRRRFRMTIASLFVAASAVMGAQFVAIQAANTPEIASGIAGKCLDDFQNGTALNNKVDIWTCTGSAAQWWQVQSDKTVRINGRCLDVTSQNTAAGSLVHLYTCNGGNNQKWNYTNHTLVGVQSGLCLDDPHSTTVNGTNLQIYTCNGTSAQKWTQTVYVPPTPAPTPPPTHAPTPAPTLQATNTPTPPGPGATPPPTGGGGTGGAGAGTAPNPPQGFAAMVSDNGVVVLSWSLASDLAGIQAYQLERSTDQTNWTVLAPDISGTNYTDGTAAFGVHYYYRLKAIDNAGVASSYVLADATTPAFTGSLPATGGGSATFISDDQVATVVIPSGAVTADADCNVSADNTHVSVGAKKVVAGPYTVICKGLDGNQITSFAQPLSWSFSIKSKLKGLKNPGAYSTDTNGNLTPITNAKYDAAGGKITFSSTSSNPVLVLAQVAPGIPWNVVAIVLFVLAVAGGVFVLIWRRQQKASYDDYLRKKYYNL